MNRSTRHPLIRRLPIPASILREPSPYRRARKLHTLRIAARRLLKDIVFMALGVSSAAFGLEGFLIPSSFIDGGATGIALLVSHLSGFSLSVMLLVINIPFMVVAYRIIGRQFAIKTSVAIATLALLTATVNFPK